jgi:hypothetical protein
MPYAFLEMTSMARLTVDELVEWTESDCGGVIVNYAPQTVQVVKYFLREFAVSTEDPFDELGAFRVGEYLVIGKLGFRDDVVKGLRTSGGRYGMDL